MVFFFILSTDNSQQTTDCHPGVSFSFIFLLRRYEEASEKSNINERILRKHLFFLNWARQIFNKIKFIWTFLSERRVASRRQGTKKRAKNQISTSEDNWKVYFFDCWARQNFRGDGSFSYVYVENLGIKMIYVLSYNSIFFGLIAQKHFILFVCWI
jgi:hypothetical protein